MLHVKKGDVILQRFSPTGFFSSAIKNSFLAKLIDRKTATRWARNRTNLPWRSFCSSF
jgi:hypothetical protein